MEWVESRLGAWSDGDRERLSRVAAPAQDLLDGAGRACLVHSDLNPKNVLVDPGTGAITGVLDWEFAHAGHPVDRPGQRAALRPRTTAYVGRHWRPGSGCGAARATAVLDGARAADLWALVDLAARSGENPVATRADRLLRAIARTGDLHAWPSGT